MHNALEAGTNQFAEALDYFPDFDTYHSTGDQYLATLEKIKARAAVPVIASLNATPAGRLGALCPTDRRTPAPTRWSSTCTTSPRTPACPRRTWRRGTWR